ncbi:hypothetical protein EW146_g4855 [Bondarzewia mesenterica]|uniref:RhoGAP-domain-containing protein n=1 Tax=Bondarzewia mesenterica TaxID=1095465 RepID=A0A4S4LZ06_9AGAM|nr:hypothetical protein EW146_g4855 [Bondarzewia mesenterica]
MLAALPSSSYSGSGKPSAALHDPSAAADNKLCPGCQLSVLNDNGGVVIAFGCSVCHQPILDEAIMTGDDSYHAHCFKCKACHNRIDELMFAKTSNGIYCMNCHYERLERSRRHAEKQKERSGGSGSSKSRDRAAREILKDSGTGSPALARTPSTAHTSTSATTSSPPSQDVHSHSSPYRAATLPYSLPANPPSSGSPRRQSMQSVSSGRQKNDHVPSVSPTHPEFQNGHTAPSSLSPSVTVAPPPSKNSSDSRSSPHYPSSPLIVSPPEEIDIETSSSLDYYLRSSEEPTNEKLLVPSTNHNSLQRRKSYDDGVRPLNHLFQRPVTADGDSGVPGLNVPNKGLNNRSKRQSINPGMTFHLDTFMADTSKSRGSPDSLVSVGRSSPMNGRESPHRASSPLREHPPDDRGGQYQTAHVPPSDNTAPLSPSLLRACAGSSSIYLPEHPKPLNRLEPTRPPLRQNNTLDRVPPRNHSLTANIPQDSEQPAARPSPALSLPGGLRPQRSFDERSTRPSVTLNDRRAIFSSLSIDVEKSRGGAGNRSRPTSPAHKVDVPHGIESGTDTEAEGESEKHSADVSEDDAPPLPPPKEIKSHARPEHLQLDSDDLMRADGADVSRVGSAAVSDESEESSPVERISHSTFIAPALPPIRFSMGGGGFSDLLQSVNAHESLKSLERLAQLSEDTIARLDSVDTPPAAMTPPPTANTEWKSTPTSDTTFTLTSGQSGLLDDASEITIEASSAPSSSFHTESGSDGHRASVSSKSSLSPIESFNKSSWTQPISRQPSSAGSLPSAKRPKANFPSSGGRSSSDLGHDVRGATSSPPAQRQRFDSNASFSQDTNVSYESSAARITVTAPGSSVARPLKYDATDLVTRRLHEALHEASKRGAMHVNLDKEFIQAILMLVEQRKVENAEMKGKLDGMKNGMELIFEFCNQRASQQYMDGLTVAHGEYDRELNARRDAEAEVTRLRVLLSGQAARITAMSSESRKGELHKQMNQELSDNLSDLERDVSKLRVERDVTLAEVEELVSSKSSPNFGDGSNAMSRSLTMRFDNLKTQYQRELVPLTEEREALLREVAELKAARDVFLEETTMLNARNEELAHLNAIYARRTEALIAESVESEKRSDSFDRQRPAVATIEPSTTVSTSVSAGTDESIDSTKYVKVSKAEVEAPPTLRGKLRWPGRLIKETTPAAAVSTPDNNEGAARSKHVFQQISLLRFTRCDHCGDKLWGSLVRCSACSVSVHPRCVNHVHSACTPQARREESASAAPLPPSMFGRELIEQVRADSKGADRMVPVVVEKCIDAVENSALEYEGIYRKTGGSGQSKIITQLFERGDYAAFDLRDQDKFNDICSITSVLKTYFRSLPNPLLTYVLHDEFMNASTIREPSLKSAKYADLVSQLPTEHYYTVRLLVLHLHRIYLRSDVNLMTARNLGVVFGPTLMRSRDPGAEFSDMAGKALSVEWLVEHAPEIFPPLSNEH